MTQSEILSGPSNGNHDQPNRDARENLVAALRGQKVRIPNLVPLIEHYPAKTHQEVNRLRTDIWDWLEK